MHSWPCPVVLVINRPEQHLLTLSVQRSREASQPTQKQFRVVPSIKGKKVTIHN